MQVRRICHLVVILGQPGAREVGPGELGVRRNADRERNCGGCFTRGPVNGAIGQQYPVPPTTPALTTSTRPGIALSTRTPTPATSPGTTTAPPASLSSAATTSTPAAAAIASSNCRSFTASWKPTSGVIPSPPVTARSNASPRASPATDAPAR